MEKRTELTAADLFVLLEREFLRRRRRDCDACFMSLPFSLAGTAAGDWDMVMPRPCPQRCEEIAEELLGEFRGRYALRPGA